MNTVVNRIAAIAGLKSKRTHLPLDTEALHKICNRVLIYVGTLFLMVAVMVLATSQTGQMFSVPAVVPPLVMFTMVCFIIRGISWPWSPVSRRIVAQLLWSVGLLIGVASSKLGAMYLINALPATLTAIILFNFRVAALQLVFMIGVIGGTVMLRLADILEPLEASNYILATNIGWILGVSYLVLIGVMIMDLLALFIREVVTQKTKLDLLLAAVEEAPDAFVVWDEQDRLVMCNEKYRNIDPKLSPYLIPGVSFEDTLRAGVKHSLYPEAVGNEENWIRQRLESHRDDESNRIVRLGDNRWMRVLESRTSLGYLAGFRTDVTEIKNGEELLKATLDSVSQAIITFGAKGEIFSANKAAATMFEYENSVLEKSGIDLFVSPRDFERIAQTDFAHTQPKASRHKGFSYPLSLKKQRSGTFDAAVEVIELEQKTQRVFMAIITDLSQENTYQNRISALGAAVEQLNAGIALFDETDSLIYSNDKLESVINLRSETNIEGMHYQQFAHHIAQFSSITRMNSGSSSVFAGLLNFFHRPDNSIELKTSDGRSLRVEGQKLLDDHSIFIFTDITEIQSQRAQLEQATKLATLGEMATGIAHEINQPLNAVKLIAENIRRGMESNQEKTQSRVGDKMQQIIAQIDRAATITTHMRKSARNATEEDLTTDTLTALNDCQNMLSARMRLDDVEWLMDVEKDLEHVDIHPLRMEQVLLNLINNALDAIAAKNTPQKWIKVSAQRNDQGQISIAMEDSAGGIPQAVMDRVFDPFFTTKEVGKGTGLGLSISFNIIQDAGGTISVENTRHGARFTITLPTPRSLPCTQAS